MFVSVVPITHYCVVNSSVWVLFFPVIYLRNVVRHAQNIFSRKAHGTLG